MADRSIVEYFAEHEKYKCGYCGGKDTNYSNGMWCHQLTVQDYQDLIDRGWRRSGCYSYKPTMSQTCCPQYTIRCQAQDFKLHKSHKKVIKRVNNYLNHGTKPAAEKEHAMQGESSLVHEDHSREPAKDVTVGVGKTPGVGKADDGNRNKQHKSENKVKPENESPKRENEVKNKEEKNTKYNAAKAPKPGVGADPSKPQSRKAKELRRERWAQKHGQSGQQSSQQASKKKNNEAKSLEDLLGETIENPTHGLELRLVRSAPRSDLFSLTFKDVHSVYHRYQTSIHKDPPEKPSAKQYTRFLVDSPLSPKLRLVRNHPRSRAFDETFVDAYNVYKLYQMAIHKDPADECDMKGYKRFLVDSPLKEESEDGDFPGFGSFHQQYLLDGKIIAVGVLDILPVCVSSVYLFYDPDYSFLSLGTYSALREVALVRQLQKIKSSIEYYYMGFYIQSCPKMKYKGNFGPASLVCPKGYTWHSLEKECEAKLEKDKYVEFNQQGEAAVDVREVLVLNRHQAMPYYLYEAINKEEEEEQLPDRAEVQEYANNVGQACAARMLLYRK